MTAVTWPCAACGFDIADGDGLIVMSFRLVRAAEAAGSGPGGGTLREISEWMEAHPRPRWAALHGVCSPPWVVDDAYGIEVERARTPQQLLSWSFHLGEKSWTDLTDWQDFVRAALKRAGQWVDA
jgi:hypothetical protein